MPFKVKKSGKGYKVFSPKGAKSKTPMSKEKALAQQKAIYANWDGKESKGIHMKKITKEEASKLLESIKVLEGMYDGGTCPDCGAPLDDEGWHAQECPAKRGGGGYRRRRSFYRPPVAAPVVGSDEAWKKYLPSFRSKAWNVGKTDDQLKPLILAWLAKQQKPTTPATPPVAESMLENEVKKELLETAGKLLQEAQKKLKGK